MNRPHKFHKRMKVCARITQSLNSGECCLVSETILAIEFASSTVLFMSALVAYKGIKMINTSPKDSSRLRQLTQMYFYRQEAVMSPQSPQSPQFPQRTEILIQTNFYYFRC